MAYKSQVKSVGYQRTSVGRQRTSPTNELSQIAESLKGFNKSFDKFTVNYKDEQQNDAQLVFDTLKTQGITDPEEIKKLIDKGDPRVANLKGYYTKAIVDSNFGLAHAIEDFNNINLQVADITGGDENSDAMANLNVDKLLQTDEGSPLRNLDNQSKSYNRTYTESLNKMRLELDSKVSVAKGLQLNRATNAASFQIIAKAWEQGGAWVDNSNLKKTKNQETDSVETTGESIYHSSTRTKDLEQLRNDKVVGEKFINKDEWNTQVLNFLEQRADLEGTGLVTDPQEMQDIVTYLTAKRGKDGSLPSYLRTPQTQEQATNIIKGIKGRVAGSTKIATTIDLLTKGEAYKKDEVVYLDKNGNQKTGLGEGDLAEGIVTWSTNLARPHIEQEVANGNIPKDLQEMALFQLTSKMLDSNGVVHPTWKNELSMGFTSLNVIKAAGNDATLDPNGVDIFDRGLARWTKLNMNYGGKIPGKYLSTEESTFYQSVDNLMRNTNMGKEAAILKTFEAVTNPTFNHANKLVDRDKIQKSIRSQFNKWGDERDGSPITGLLFLDDENTWDMFKASNPKFRWEDVDMSVLQQRAEMTAMTMYKSGANNLEDSVEWAIKEVVSRHTLVDGAMVNNSSFPNVSSETLTDNSRFVAKAFAKVWEDKYRAEGRDDNMLEEGAFNPFKANDRGDLKYYPDELVMRPFKSGLFILTDKTSGLPVTTPSLDYVILSTKDFIHADGKLANAPRAAGDTDILLKNASMMKDLQISLQTKINKVK